MILTNCRLIPELCEGFQEEMADIRVEGNTIAEILPAGGRYTGEKVIDCTGKTVLPGLFNIHCHLFFHTTNWAPIELQTEYMHLSNSYRHMQRLMSYGFTSLRDVGTPYNCANKLRDSINAGEIVGPNIKACGNILTPYMVAPPLPYSSLYGRPVNGPYQIRAEVRRTLQEGSDFIKILGCSAAPTSRGDGPLFCEDEREELVRLVKEEGTYLAIHTNSEESNAAAIEMETHSIEHGFFWSQDNMDQLIAHDRKSTIVPTLQICVAMAGAELTKPQVAGLRMPYDDGILMGWGTDATEEMFMSAPGLEFTAREELLGFSKLDILKQATINSAKIIGTDDLHGSIKVGKRADFAVIDGKPDQDLSLFNQPPAWVIKDGQVVAREGLVKS